ncbi:unnamed protein product [Larinioides sclopetarius]|uniref:Uncharacterized protein n=1 Tax=Larinioides sclopetarius TaxID=280406 RepID=A0AAV2B8I2_9ARAC
MEKSEDELHKADQIGHRACSDENRENCMKTDAMKVRCSATATPSEECIAELTAYLQGETCNQ